MDLVNVFANKIRSAPLDFFESKSGRRLQAKMLRLVRGQLDRDAGKAMRNELTVAYTTVLLMPA